MWESPPIEKLQEAIENPNNPIGMRMRSAYFLKQAYENAIRNKSSDDDDDNNSNNATVDIDDVVVQTLCQGLLDPRHGSLLRHEFAYVMGQTRDERCCQALEEVLSNNQDCIMVRHECGEALGAISASRSIPILENVITTNPHSPEITETCEISLEHMKWRIRGDPTEEEPMVCACMANPYSSVDPAPAHPQHINLSTTTLGEILRNVSLPLFERYRAMFSLRNRGGSDSVLELSRGLVEDESSVLLRHEIAFVLGQMQHPDSLEALVTSLKREDEHAMVRHESAEALGAIESRWVEVEAILKEFLEDPDVVVRESCVVALDAADYWGYGSNGCDENEDVMGQQSDSPVDEDEKLDIEASSSLQKMSFVQQKANTNGKNSDANKPQLCHRFNISST